MKTPWACAVWIPTFGLSIWSYGFNNIPLVRPLPLVDALVAFAVLFSFPQWWRLRRIKAVRRVLVFLSALTLVVGLRLGVDVPRFGLLALRDALFVFELWALLPAIALGTMLGHIKLNRRLFWLFSIATLWFLLYPWRDEIMAVSPVFGIQRPTPLFAFTTAGFLSVPAFFWFLSHLRTGWDILAGSLVLTILLLVQSRGSYLALLGCLMALLLVRPATLKRWWRLAVAGGVLGGLLMLVGTSLTGRLGEPIGIDTAVAQLQTLTGEDGPGAGSFEHRLVAWPLTVQQVIEAPLGPFIGVGLGTDLFQGFALGPDIRVRKPHNDFIEIWGRLGAIGLFLWLGTLCVAGAQAVSGVRRSATHCWILALQVTLWITSVGQPAMAFAYVTVVWATLTGLWIGSQLNGRGLLQLDERLQPVVARSLR